MRHVNQRKYSASVVAAETTSEAAVGLLGIVVDSFSFESDFELLGGLFQLIKEGKDSKSSRLSSEMEAQSVERSGEWFGAVRGRQVPGTVQAQRPAEV